MLIHSISLSNFLCYSGFDNHFAFSEGLNLVLGANGYGKSKLYDAFQWVFNDGITDTSARAKLGGLMATSAVKGELVSEKAKAACAVGDSVETKVVVEVSDHRNTAPKRYQLVRTYRIRRDEARWVEPSKSEFRMLEYDIISFKPVPDDKHAEILQRLVPVDVRPYVWFQGERGINNLIDTSSDDSLRRVIQQLSDIERWDRYIDVTKKAHETARNAFDLELRKSRKNEQRVSELQADYEAKQRRIQKLNEEYTQAGQNLRAAEDKKAQHYASLEYAETIQRFTQSRDEAKRAYDRTIKEAEAFEEGISKKLFTDNWLLMGTSGLIGEFEQKFLDYNTAIADRKAAENLTKARHEKLQVRLPENVPEPMYVQQMLDKERCLVCDREAPHGSDAYEAIASLLLPDMPPTQPAATTRQNLAPLFRQLYGVGLAMKASVEGVAQRVQQSMAEQNQFNYQIGLQGDDLKSKDNDLRDQIQKSGITNARDIINSMDAAISDITTYSKRIASLKGQIEQLEKEQKAISDKLAELSEGQVSPHLLQKQTLLYDLAELAKRVRKAKYQELVKQLEDTANEHYRNINGPTGAFHGMIRFVENGEDGYLPTIIDQETGQKVGNLNTSLVSSLKLSIIMAIVSANKTRNYTGFYPLIADAPVSDFDVVKAMTFFGETAHTFRQSIVIVKELLIEDDDRPGRYKPDLDRLGELKTAVAAADKALTVYQLDIPDGISNTYRHELEITIRQIAC